MTDVKLQSKDSTGKDSLPLRGYIAFSNHATTIFRYALKRRLKNGKEHPQRYTEKLGDSSAARAPGTLIWLHGVGLGEVLALRGLIRAIHARKPEIHFLVTSSTRTSAEVFCNNLPVNTTHQMLPLDSKPFIKKFLNHWQPNLSVWAEQDLWPAMVYHTHARSIPLVLLNARMNEKSYRARTRLTSLYRDLYKRFEWISAQDNQTAANMQSLGANVTTGGSLKTASVPLQDHATLRHEFAQRIAGRHCWLLASSHREDEALALHAHRKLLQQQPEALLIIAPRLIERKPEIIETAIAHGMKTACRSDNQSPSQCNVYIADTFGEMGIWYRLSPCAFIGGSMSDVQGHNPWEAAVLGCAIVHGPNTENFLSDYQLLQKNNAATCVSRETQLLQTLQDQQRLETTAKNALQLAGSNNQQVELLADRLIETLKGCGNSTVKYNRSV